MEKKEILVNGVYFLLANGTFVLAGSEEVPGKEQIEMIGVAHDGHYFAIPLDWDIYGKRPLMNHSCSRDDKFCKTEMEALCDWDFVSATKHLQSLGMAFELKEGHYLPTPAALLAMFSNKEAINSALDTAGAQTVDFDGSYVWSCLRSSCYHAWYAYGVYGFFGNYNMYYSYLAVPLSLWNPIP